jgi:hypothetical protein
VSGNEPLVTGEARTGAVTGIACETGCVIRNEEVSVIL